ncbi:NAD-dependent DNA ligase LigA [Candidatus Mycoplasma haematominutum]|uniref:DNA ligase n=1 Tax=Candidatus Mycoplasma haematominutum 'Birmingham 1' TaxID=1116213 RepID=G8C2Y9_9MOLU|nr:NAD-dependent DNA ligase LigA [Candidatus Mycoplasma haematominutum]CCE66687.1 DNA ligase [Candidatus Mycoplasma haematominutum 'Birmingham 1']
MEKNKKIQQLREEILSHDEKYYKGESEIPDELHDFKVRKLKILEGTNTGVGHVSSERKNFKMRHEYPMLSLNNAFNEEELFSIFFNAHKKILGIESVNTPIEYFVEPKIDGVSVSLHYRYGQLVKAISRGDGQFGEDWTNQISHIMEIPKRVPMTEEFYVRGEIFVSKCNFRKIQSSTKEGEKSFINSRSYVSGALRLKDSAKIGEKLLSFISYQVLFIDGNKFKTQSESIEFLRKSGFPTHQSQYSLKSSQLHEILNFLSKFGEKRKDWEIPNDGLVLKVNELTLHPTIGSTSKFPKWAIAYKYPSLIKETILERIEATVGRSGRITYIGKLSPIYIDGSWIKWVTLHNYENVKMLKLHEGIVVQVYKSGEIIPRVISATPKFDKAFPIISHCPSCQSKLIFREGEKLQYCVNDNCERQKICKIIYFCSKKGVNVEGLSEQIITKLYSSKIINTLIDIFYLNKRKQELFKLTTLNIREKSFQNLMHSIEKSIKAPPEKILCGLGIDYIGITVSRLLLKKFSSIDNIFNSSLEEKINIEGIGPKSAKSIQDWLQNHENQLLIYELKKIGFNFSVGIAESVKVDVNHFLFGKTAVITGTFSISREKIKQALAIKYELQFRDSISKNVDFLLVGANAGSKVQQAHQHNIEILNLQEVESIISSLD